MWHLERIIAEQEKARQSELAREAEIAKRVLARQKLHRASRILRPSVTRLPRPAATCNGLGEHPLH